MFKILSLAITAFILGGAGAGWAQESLAALWSVMPQVSAEEEAYPVIFELRDRIQIQQNQINEDFLNHSLSEAKWSKGLYFLKSVEAGINKAVAGGTKKMSVEQYNAFNHRLDQNAAVILENKEYFDAHGSYAGDFYYVQPADPSPGPQASAREKAHPAVYELDARIRNQRYRMTQALGRHTLSLEEADRCERVLNSVENQMNADYNAGGFEKMSAAQYDACNQQLDDNSAAIDGNPHFFEDDKPTDERNYFTL
jgi:hypothetical protein